MCVCTKEKEEDRRKEEGQAGRSHPNPCNSFRDHAEIALLSFFSPYLSFPRIEKNDPVGEGLAADTHSPICNGRREVICRLTRRVCLRFPRNSMEII